MSEGTIRLVRGDNDVKVIEIQPLLRLQYHVAFLNVELGRNTDRVGRTVSDRPLVRLHLVYWFDNSRTAHCVLQRLHYCVLQMHDRRIAGNNVYVHMRDKTYPPQKRVVLCVAQIKRKRRLISYCVEHSPQGAE